MKKKLRKSILVGFLLLAVSLWVFQCKKKKDDNSAALSLIALTAQQTEASKNVGQVTTAVSGVVSSVVSAAKGGQVTQLFSLDPKDKLLAMHKGLFLKQIKKLKKAHAIPTAITASNGTCNVTSCSATLNGTSSCSQGGSFTLTNMVMNMTYPNSNSFTGTTKGAVSLTNCGAQAADYLNFPNMVSVISTGDITIDGSVTSQINSLSATGNSLTGDLNYKNKTKFTSLNLVINKAPAMSIDATTDLDVHVITKATNVVSTSTSNSYSFSADYSDTLNGTASASGTANGVGFSKTRVYTNETFNYKVSCSMDLTAQTADCKLIQ